MSRPAAEIAHGSHTCVRVEASSAPMRDPAIWRHPPRRDLSRRSRRPAPEGTKQAFRRLVRHSRPPGLRAVEARSRGSRETVRSSRSAEASWRRDRRYAELHHAASTSEPDFVPASAAPDEGWTDVTRANPRRASRTLHHQRPLIERLDQGSLRAARPSIKSSTT